jgi:hypothetical protein
MDAVQIHLAGRETVDSIDLNLSLDKQQIPEWKTAGSSTRPFQNSRTNQ